MKTPIARKPIGRNTQSVTESVPNINVRPLVMRPLLISLLWLVPIGGMRSESGEHHHFADLVDAIHAVRKKTIVEAYFRLEVDQFPAAPFVAPDAKGEAYFVLPLARIFAEAPSPKEIAEEISNRPSRYPVSYDSARRRLAYYPPEVVADLRRKLAPWLLTPEQLASLPFLQLAHEVIAARIPRDREEEFVDALLSSLFHASRKEFKCIVGWN